ncbi:MAG: hypothetical protein Q9160_004426 [Pyrenula sp. 1 TL-2023]
MAFPYRHVLMIGATAGIGAAMADRLIIGGSKVTVVGRRRDRLDDFVRKHDDAKAQAAPFDIANFDQIPHFAANIMRTSPDIDCIFLNAGIQRRHDFSKPESVNLAEFNTETAVNYTSFVALTHAFLPYLLQKETAKTSIIFTGSNLAIVPAVAMPGYSASKAALNAFTLCLRDQLRNTNVRILELSPPPVQTELHDATMGETVGRALGMPLDQFTEQAYAALAREEEQIIIGSVGDKARFHDIVQKRVEAFEWLSGVMRAHA